MHSAGKARPAVTNSMPSNASFTRGAGVIAALIGLAVVACSHAGGSCAVRPLRVLLRAVGGPHVWPPVPDRPASVARAAGCGGHRRPSRQSARQGRGRCRRCLVGRSGRDRRILLSGRGLEHQSEGRRPQPRKAQGLARPAVGAMLADRSQPAEHGASAVKPASALMSGSDLADTPTEQAGLAR